VAISEAELLAAFRRLERPLYSVLYRWLWHAHDCQDLIQDTFLRVWDQRQSVDAARLDALIYASALNLARNKLRWRGLWRWGEIDPEAAGEGSDGPVAMAERRQREQVLKRVLESLDRDSRNLLLLSECAGLTTEELVAVFGWPAGTVASRKHRALARLREALMAQGIETTTDVILENRS
jgi:RNA polymerase sigma-70 factor (ECF subfamily)